MTFNPEIQAINQTLQFGLEATPGTNVAANKLLQCFAIDLGPMADTSEFTATGRKYPSVVIENSEWTEGDLKGELDYNGIVYLLSAVSGAAVIGAAGSSTTAKSWVWTPPLTGSVQPQTYTIEQGDSVRAHKVNYGLFTEFAYKGDRKAGFNISSKLLAQQLQDPITKTSSPTAVALQPSAGKHFNVYLDPTSAALGTTQLLRVLDVDYNFSGIYGPFFALNRAFLGWTAHVDLKPKATMKLLLEADAVGMGQLPILQAGTTQFMRVQGQGLVIDNNQTLTFGGGVTSGNFTLTYKGQTTANIAYAVTLPAATIQTAFQLLSTVGVNCTVSGPNGGPYVFTFSGLLATDTTAMTATNVSLLGGTPTIVVTQTQVYALFQHDMAVKISKPDKYQDKDGVFANIWEFTIVEDATWGKSQLFTVQTLLTGL